MTSQSVNPRASSALTQGRSTDKDAEKPTINNSKKEKGIGLVTGWLRMVEPRKVPYFPQKRDEIVYLRQAHESYLKEVQEHTIFPVKTSDKLWIKMKMNNDIEYLTVVNVSFEKHPTRVACLDVRRTNTKEEENEPVYKLRYHDMGDVVDFLVLKHIFNEGLQKKWNVGDEFRCLVGNNWFFGTIKSIEPFDKKYPKSPFKSFKIKWDDEEELDELSPWEVQNISRKPKNHGEPVEVLNIEIINMRYKPVLDDWPDWEDWKANIKKIVSEFDYLIDKLGISKCFIEIKNDPVYDALVLYPIDLSTIRERIDKYFYRRIDALLMDIFYLKENAKQHKPEKLAKEAILITEYCEEIISKKECDSSSFSKDFLTNFNSSESEDDDNEYNPSGSSNKKGFNSNSKNCWKKGCEELLTTLWKSEDILAFRQPVCREDYPDYYKVISSPICLEEINKKFYSDQYESQKDFFGDIKLLITNSREYNTDKTKAIYFATTRVSALFDELKKQINVRKDSPRKNVKKNHQKKNELDEFIPISSRGKPKYSIPKSNKERIVCSSTQSTKQKKNSTNEKKPENELIVDEKRIHTKNNNYKKDLTESLSHKTNKTNIGVKTSNVTVKIQNEGKENLVQSMELDDSNHSSRSLLHQTQSPNEDFRMETDEGKNTNNGNNSGCNSEICEISQSQRSKCMELIIIDSDDDVEEERQKVIKIAEKAKDPTQSQNHGDENRDKDVNNSLQKRSNFKKSLASFKAKKRMLLQYNHIFRHRPYKSCVTCQSIKQVFLDHLKSHQF